MVTEILWQTRVIFDSHCHWLYPIYILLKKIKVFYSVQKYSAQKENDLTRRFTSSVRFFSHTVAITK